MVLEDWTCVRAALQCGTDVQTPEEKGGGGGGGGGGGEWPFLLTPSEQHQVLSTQSSTQHLDCLTHTLLSKMNHHVSLPPLLSSPLLSSPFSLSLQVVEGLVTTLVRRLGHMREDAEVSRCCERFLRSVVRVMLVCELEWRGSTPSAVVVTGGASVNSKRRRCVMMMV